MPLPSKLVLEHVHPDQEMRQEEQENFDTAEAIEDMIQMYFRNSGNGEKQDIKTIEDIEKKHKQNGNHNSQKNLSGSCSH